MWPRTGMAQVTSPSICSSTASFSHSGADTMTLTEAPAAVRELWTLNQWVAWKLDERDGEWTKIPIRGVGGGLASSTDPATWCDYEKARARARLLEKKGLKCGVGFVVTREGGLTGVDIDK